MIEPDTIRLLRECDAGIKMGTKAIDDVLDRVESDTLTWLLRECRDEHCALEQQLTLNLRTTQIFIAADRRSRHFAAAPCYDGAGNTPLICGKTAIFAVYNSIFLLYDKPQVNPMLQHPPLRAAGGMGCKAPRVGHCEAATADKSEYLGAAGVSAGTGNCASVPNCLPRFGLFLCACLPSGKRAFFT